MQGPWSKMFCWRSAKETRCVECWLGQLLRMCVRACLCLTACACMCACVHIVQTYIQTCVLSYVEYVRGEICQLSLIPPLSSSDALGCDQATQSIRIS